MNGCMKQSKIKNDIMVEPIAHAEWLVEELEASRKKAVVDENMLLALVLSKRLKDARQLENDLRNLDAHI